MALYLERLKRIIWRMEFCISGEPLPYIPYIAFRAPSAPVISSEKSIELAIPANWSSLNDVQKNVLTQVDVIRP